MISPVTTIKNLRLLAAYSHQYPTDTRLAILKETVMTISSYQRLFQRFKQITSICQSSNKERDWYLTYSALLRKRRNEDTLILVKEKIIQPNKISILSNNNLFRALIFWEICLQMKHLNEITSVLTISFFDDKSRKHDHHLDIKS